MSQYFMFFLIYALKPVLVMKEDEDEEINMYPYANICWLVLFIW